ncbi:hypothetical protein JTE90_014518 [Oedothorax gibbosus]|uniref:Golgi integral membrane protein 4 n=1 Tax=Oedothorax gibbosus TaxID=931172 RepID=A0AAV6VM70_9ARAC|nr:hypothetical protein JTE90_014518 [Oedothorax gibbosus]
MGEQKSSYSSNPAFIVIMRNSRGKLFVYITVLGVICFFVFLLSSTHSSLKELEGVNDKCQQQRDSLSAQLQVVYEHKNRLEKSLQQEKSDHKHTREGNEKQLSELESKFQKEKDDKQKLEIKLTQLKTSYTELEDEKTQSENALKQQFKNTEFQKDEEIKKLQNHITNLLAEKEKLETANGQFTYKLEQTASEKNLCHLQLQQAKSDLSTCQEQMRMHNVNGHNTNKEAITGKVDQTPVKVEEKPQLQEDAQNNIPVKNPDLPKEKEVLLPLENQEAKENTMNATAHPPHERVSVLDKPRLMPANNLGDGVLPKPLDMKHDEQENNILDAANEVLEPKRRSKPIVEPLVNRVVDQYAKLRNYLPNENMRINPAAANKDDHPQVAAPNFENVEEKEDHAGERGEDGNQYNPDARPQVEEPVLGKQPPVPKEVFPPQENNDIAAQMNDMMNKSPGNINNAVEHNVLRIPPHLQDNKNPHEGAFMHRGADAQRVMDDKNYEEDDDERDNDDEPLNGLAPVAKGAHNILQDNDFDDQENQDNAIGDNAKEEEGVVVAPK